MYEIYLFYENKSIQLLPERKYFIGRDTGCDIVLRHKFVSRRHASLEYRDGNILLVDLNSSNGTWYEGKRISSVRIRSNSSFRIAENNLAIRAKMEGENKEMIRLDDTMMFERKVTGIISRVENPEIKDEVFSLKKLYNQKKEKLTELAFYDTLTGIYNRRYFEIKIREEVASALRLQRMLSLLLIDIDRFKGINDTYGHQKGDTVLTAVAGILRDSVRTSDIVCRYGGEEIAIILPETAGRDAIRIAENCRQKIERQTQAEIQIAVTASIGVSEFDGDMETQGLIKCADHCLYQAKRRGRNRVVAEKCRQATTGDTSQIG